MYAWYNFIIYINYVNILWNYSQKSKLNPQRYEIKVRFSSESWCCWLLANNLIIKIHRTLILYVLPATLFITPWEGVD
jgi:hypothetical protein